MKTCTSAVGFTDRVIYTACVIYVIVSVLPPQRPATQIRVLTVACVPTAYWATFAFVQTASLAPIVRQQVRRATCSNRSYVVLGVTHLGIRAEAEINSSALCMPR